MPTAMETGGANVTAVARAVADLTAASPGTPLRE